jgi:hypothetical protein
VVSAKTTAANKTGWKEKEKKKVSVHAFEFPYLGALRSKKQSAICTRVQPEAKSSSFEDFSLSRQTYHDSWGTFCFCGATRDLLCVACIIYKCVNSR